MLYELTFGLFELLTKLCDKIGELLFSPAKDSINEAANDVKIWFLQNDWEAFNWLRDILASFIEGLVRAPSFIVGNEPFIVWILGGGFVTFIVIWLICKIVPIL